MKKLLLSILLVAFAIPGIAYAVSLPVEYYGCSFDESTSSPTCVRTGSLKGVAAASKPDDSILPIQAAMRRCILSDAGAVVYYLNATDSTKKQDGGASVLTGADGQVMVEIPKFYYRYGYSGTIHTWDISLQPLSGFILHPAFNKDGAVVDYRYIGVYEGVLYDTSESKYVNGLYLPTSASYKMTFTNADDKIQSDTLTHPFTNLEVGVDKIVVSVSDTNDGTYNIVTKGDDYITIGAGGTLTNEANSEVTIQVQRDWTATSGDKLSSVSGKAPMNYGTRANFREVALNRGVGWRQLDYDLASAIQLLYLVEYASFYSQSMIGAGLTDWAAGWSVWNNYNPIETTGNSNSDGNVTANNSAGDATAGSYMSYRGIENFYGHIWKWVDGININGGIPYVSNTETDFADDTATAYTRLEDTGGSGITLPQGTNHYQVTLEQIARGFMPASVTGSSSTYICDYYWQAANWRVVLRGASAYFAGQAGVFALSAHYAISYLSQYIGGSLCY